VPEVDANEAKALVDSGALLLDVREPNEWNAGHAPGAHFVPLGQLPANVDDLPRDRRIVAVCRVGGRSARATEFLIAAGIDAVNLAGGMRAWAAAGLTVETDDGGAGTVI
jgi:rhodanese-related sulfurtransferase